MLSNKMIENRRELLAQALVCTEDSELAMTTYETNVKGCGKQVNLDYGSSTANRVIANITAYLNKHGVVLTCE